jgi:hypothetical protein
VRLHKVWIAVTLVVAGCGGPAPTAVPSRGAVLATPTLTASAGVTTPSPATSPAPTPTAPRASLTPEPESATPESTSGPGPRPGFRAGECVLTVSDDVRVRSNPGVGSDSRRYRPLLPEGTYLCISAGPIAASGYWWYEVELDAGQLDGGITRGWVAAGDHDGSPWIAHVPDTGPGTMPVPELPAPIVEYLEEEVNEAPDGSAFIRYRFSVLNWEDFKGLSWDEPSDDGPCEGAGRIFAQIAESDGVPLNRFCRLSDAFGLTDLWFDGPYGEAPPVVWLEIWDVEADEQTFSSPMQIESIYTSHESPTP